MIFLHKSEWYWHVRSDFWAVSTIQIPCRTPHGIPCGCSSSWPCITMIPPSKTHPSPGKPSPPCQVCAVSFESLHCIYGQKTGHFCSKFCQEKSIFACAIGSAFFLLCRLNAKWPLIYYKTDNNWKVFSSWFSRDFCTQISWFIPILYKIPVEWTKKITKKETKTATMSSCHWHEHLCQWQTFR